jgi:hypothetical protein
VTTPERKPDKLRRNTTLALGVTGVLASALLTGCSTNGDVIDADYAKVCRDEKTQQRTEDKNCESSSGRSGGAYGWYFYQMGNSSRSLPAVGQPLAGGVTSLPSGKSAKSGVAVKGSPSVSRGGFGGSAKGTGG